MVTLRSSEYTLVRNSRGTVPPFTSVGVTSSNTTPLSNRKSNVAAFSSAQARTSSRSLYRSSRFPGAV